MVHWSAVEFVIRFDEKLVHLIIYLAPVFSLTQSLEAAPIRINRRLPSEMNSYYAETTQLVRDPIYSGPITFHDIMIQFRGSFLPAVLAPVEES